LYAKGRTRIWLDDQSWWLGIAEFKPSNRKPGAYLNVGPMFLWHPADRYIFEIGGQGEGSVRRTAPTSFRLYTRKRSVPRGISEHCAPASVPPMT
jgi:hypothetical protein